MKIIYGRAGCGKSEYVFNDIKKQISNGNKIYIVTPEQFSFTAEKRLLDTLENEAVLKAEVLSFERMAYRVINETLDNIVMKLEKSGKSMIIWDSLNRKQKELNFLGKSLDNVDTILTQITEFKKHNISLENIKKQVEETKDKYLQAKLNDMCIMYESLENVVKDDFIDENDLLTILAENLEKSHLFDNSIFYIDEFSGFTKQEYSVIEKIEKVAKELYITVCTDDLRVIKSPEADIFYDNKQAVQSLLNICDIDREKQIHLDKNYRFKNEELAFMEQNIFGLPYKVYNKEVQNIELSYADNQYIEIENVATKIIKLVRDKHYRFRDCAVICNNIETYSSLCKVIFREYGIPVFIDEKKDIAQNVLVKYVLAVLDIFAKGWSYDAVFNYVKTGIVGISNIYEFENYCLKWGIQGKKFYKSPWDYEKLEWNDKLRSGKEVQQKSKDTKEDEERLKELNFNEDQQKLVEPLLELKNKIDTNRTVEQISKLLYDFLKENLLEKDLKAANDDISIRENLNDTKSQKFKSDLRLRNELNSEENIEAFNLIIDVIGEITRIFNDRKISFDDYSKILKTGLATKELNQIPPTQDKVIVGDVNRSKTHKVKVVFIIGVNDGIFPRALIAEGFFNDKDRENLKTEGFELAKGTKEKMYEENFNIYKAFSTAEERLYISYAASDINGDNLRKSLIISRIKRIFPKLQEHEIEADQVLTKNITFSKLLNNLENEEWLEVYEWYKNNYSTKLENAMKGLKYSNVPSKINKDNIEKLYGNNLKTSISRLEKYSSCPFSYYLRYGLKLSDKEKLDVKPVDTGSFMHDVIDTFFKSLDDYVITKERRIRGVYRYIK